jgi:hypothetical protein
LFVARGARNNMVFKTEKSEDNALSKKKKESALLVKPEKKIQLNI